MRRNLVYLSRASRSLADILAPIFRKPGRLPTAQALVERLRRRCRRLASLPGTLGRPRPELGSGIRSTPDGDYVIFFRYRPERVEIIAVLRRYRDVKRIE